MAMVTHTEAITEATTEAITEVIMEATMEVITEAITGVTMEATGDMVDMDIITSDRSKAKRQSIDKTMALVFLF